MDIWAFCGTCRRWFHCPSWFDRTQPQPRCQLCHTEPTAIENRAAGRPSTDHAGTSPGWRPSATPSAWPEPRTG